MLKTALVLALGVAPMLPGAAVAGTLPANVEVPVTLASEISSQRMKAGESFEVRVARDVWVAGQLAIPRGTRGQGAVTWRTGKGAFGKSGKIEIEVRSLDLAGVAVPLTGKYREEGQGNTGATIGTIVVAGLVGGAFVTGRSAVFEQGRELRAFTTRPVALVATPAVVAQPAAIVVPAVASPTRPAPVAMVAWPVMAAATAATSVPVALPVRTPAVDDPYRRLLAAQQGVHGRSAQGWTISD